MTAPTARGATLSPGDVARQCGVSTDTLRHYERKGLLPRPARSAGGYRRYAPETIARVLLVQRALVVGFTLDELARVLRDRDRGAPPCRGVRDLVAARLADLEVRLAQLTALRSELHDLLTGWDRTLAGTPPGQPAHLLQALVGHAAIAEAGRDGTRARPRAVARRRA